MISNRFFAPGNLLSAEVGIPTSELIQTLTGGTPTLAWSPVMTWTPGNLLALVVLGMILGGLL